MSKYIQDAPPEQQDLINNMLKELHSCLMKELAKISSHNKDDYLLNTLFGLATAFNGFLLHKLSVLTSLEHDELLEAYITASRQAWEGEIKGNLQ